MAIAHLIHGYLGAGKTTFSKNLEQETAAIRFTHDEWMSRLYGEDPPEREFNKMAKRVSMVMESVWQRCLQLNTDVILDFGFWSREERDCIRSIVSGAGASFRLYRLACDDDIAWARIQARNISLEGSLYIAKETFSLLKARFEPLGDDESRVEVI